MPAFETQAIVLRRAQYRESDRMVTLFSPELGRIDALARGCKKPGGTMAVASELFSMGLYQIFRKGERATVTGFSLTEGYYPLRTELDRLGYACYALGLCEAVVQPELAAPELFELLTGTLASLAYDGQADPRLLGAAFLVGFAACAGFRPELGQCARCGRDATGRDGLVFDVEEGGICCEACAPEAEFLSAEVLGLMRGLQEHGLAGAGDVGEETLGRALGLLRLHVESRMEGRVKAGRFLGLGE